MKFTGLLAAGSLALAMFSQPILADESSLSDAQKTEIQKLIHDYLVSNPEVLLEVSQALQQKQQQSAQKQALASIQENANELFTDKLAMAGNPKGNVTLVEFFDYQCIHCKKMDPVIGELIKKDSNLRVIYKEFPIFGEDSDKASRAALAAGMQNKYQAMHDALFKQGKKANEKAINQIAKTIGLDMKKFKADMAGKPVTEALDSNRKLAEKLHLMGTPAFIVASTPNGKFKDGSQPDFVPGAASADVLQGLIKKAANAG